MRRLFGNRGALAGRAVAVVMLCLTLVGTGVQSGAAGRRAAVLLAAGDIASCDSRGDEATARLLDRLDGRVATLGDNAYRAGSPAEFRRCYDPTWGRHKERTRPALGNHEYNTPDAAGYFDYFGARAGPAGKGYYSYDLGAWHIVVLNSNCAEVGGCEAGSAQETWLRADLEANPRPCTLAYWHHPLFSSGVDHGGTTSVWPLWQALDDHGADVVLSGHEHNYERFAPQDPDGNLDLTGGIRQFVVGTGGASSYEFGAAVANSEVRQSGTFGALKLTLRPTSYDWAFVPAAGGEFSDAGHDECH